MYSILRIFLFLCVILLCGSEAPTETPVSSPTEVPVSSPTETPVRSPTEIPVRSPTEIPVRSPTETPIAAPTVAPTGTSSMSYLYSTFYSTYSHGSMSTANTVAPTETPTVAPTTQYVVTMMTYACSQSLVNCSATQFDASSASQQVFKAAVANSTVGVTAADVTITSIAVAVAGTSTLDTPGTATAVRRRLPNTGSNGNAVIVFNITVDINDSMYGTAAGAYNAISTTLAVSVIGDLFNSNLAFAAAAAGDSVLLYTSSDSITQFAAVVTTVDLSPTVAPTTPAEPKAPPGQMLLLPLGVSIGVLMLGVLIYVFRRPNNVGERRIVVSAEELPLVSISSAEAGEPVQSTRVLNYRP